MPYLFVPADPAPPPTRTPSLLAARVSSYVLEVFGTLSGVWIDGASLLGGASGYPLPPPCASLQKVPDVTLLWHSPPRV